RRRHTIGCSAAIRSRCVAPDRGSSRTRRLAVPRSGRQRQLGGIRGDCSRGRSQEIRERRPGIPMKISVLTGGSSAERSVALASAGQVVRALRQRDHQVLVVDTTTGVLDAAGEAELLAPGVRAVPTDLTALAVAERDTLLGG